MSNKDNKSKPTTGTRTSTSKPINNSQKPSSPSSRPVGSKPPPPPKK